MRTVSSAVLPELEYNLVSTSSKKNVIYEVIAVDILAEKASTLKYACVISKKSQTISVVWFKRIGLDCTEGSV